MDSFRFVSWSRILTPKRFVSYRSTNPDFTDSQVRFFRIRIVDSFCDLNFQRFAHFYESYESSRILSTIDLRIHTNPWDSDSRICMAFKRFVLWIRFVEFFRKIRFVDSIRGFVFERFVLWIRFVKNVFPNYSIRFVSKDSYTNPASLIKSKSKN
jgi:hypothetical protein